MRIVFDRFKSKFGNLATKFEQSIGIVQLKIVTLELDNKLQLAATMSLLEITSFELNYLNLLHISIHSSINLHLLFWFFIGKKVPIN